MQKVKALIMFILTIVILLISTSFPILAITTNLESDLVLKIQLVLASNGNYLEGEESIIIKFVNGNDGSIMWRKAFNNTYINQGGEITLAIKGLDDNGVELATWMFDSTDVYLTISLNGEDVDLELLSQPYAIKSLISEVSYDTSGINGIAVKEVESLEENDILVSNAGKWQPIGVNDSNTGLIFGLDKILALESLTDININGIKEGDLIKYNGVIWENVLDHSMNKIEFAELIESKGYIQNFSIDDLQGGDYPPIIGIGGVIKITSDNIYLMDDVEIEGNLLVFNNLGSEDLPVNRMSMASVIIGSEDQISVMVEDDYLKFNQQLKIQSKNGRLITGEGDLNKIAIFTNDYSISYDQNLLWNSDIGQLGVIEGVDNSEVDVNIKGSFRVASELKIQNEQLSLSEYLKQSDVSLITFSGSYNDLRNISDLNDFKSSEEFQSEILEYYTNLEMVNLIDEEILTYKETQLPDTIQQLLINYETIQSADQRVDGVLKSTLYTENEMDDRYYDDEEISVIMSEYYDDQVLEGILIDYIEINDISTLGLSGDYMDLMNRPNILLVPDFDEFKSIFEITYADDFEVSERILSATSNLNQEVMSLVSRNYVTKEGLENRSYGYQSEVDSLSDLARTGVFDDILNVPDLSNFMTSAELNEQFISSNAFLDGLSFYILDNQVATVAKTAEFSDLVNYPDIELYFPSSELENYVLNSTLESNLDGVLKVGENIDLDLQDYITELDLMNSLNLYALEGGINIIAKSNNFSDLINAESIIMNDQLEYKMSEYVLFEAVENLEADLNDMDLELSDRLETGFENLESDLRDQIVSLLSEYDKSVTVDSKINSKKDSFISNELSQVIDGELESKVLKTDFNTMLLNYSSTQNIKDSLDEISTNYVTTENLANELINYVTDDELFSLGFLMTESLNLEIGGSPIIISGNVTISKNLTIDEGLFIDKLAVGNGLFNHGIEVSESIGNKLLIQFTNSVTGTENSDGFFIGLDENEYLKFEINEDAGLDILSNSNYAMSINGNGNVGIGVTEPSFNIDISGDINIDGQIYSDGNEYEGSVFKRSDEEEGIVFLLDENVYIGSEPSNSSNKLNVNGTISASSFEGDASLLTGVDSIPIGLIVMWSGAISDIPEKWALCNGQNNTPNLSGKFLIQYHETSFPTIGATGGSSSTTLSESNLPSHSHSVSMNSSGYHYHRLSASSVDDHNHSGNENRFMDVDAGYRTSRKSNTGSNSGDHTHSVSMSSVGNGQSFENRPPYYVLAYIQYQGQ